MGVKRRAQMLSVYTHKVRRLHFFLSPRISSRVPRAFLPRVDPGLTSVFFDPGLTSAFFGIVTGDRLFVSCAVS